MPTLKLIYFNAASRAECTRLAFYIGNIPFQDVRLSFQEFEELQPTLPYDQVPVLVVDGQVIAQSHAILRYAGRLSGLYPVNDPVAALKVDEVLGTMDELGQTVGRALRVSDLEKHKTMSEKLGAETIPKYFGLINKQLAEMKEYAMREYTPDHIPNTVCDGFEAVDELIARVRGHPKWQEYYANPRNVAPKLKLTYLNEPGRVEATRLALHMGGVPFKDERLDEAEFAARQAELPFGQLPVLSVNDALYRQPLQILRYAGTLSGLYSTTKFEQSLRVDEVLCLLDDLYNVILPTSTLKGDELQATRYALKTTTLPKALGSLNKRIGGWEGAFAVDSELTVADLAIYASRADVQSGRLLGEPIEVEHEHLKRVADHVARLPKVQELTQTTTHQVNWDHD
ncbi:hypothetical protein Poli38472_009684 [Pythium oligandrum]|uniref:Glutathione S-transferase n=1 Tax=Pythium oligandrum TaxID=41045 RepID=A0A8K1FH01_PYTOL|nr:hypothetical protein Poli38472_009684 [Pythium oligandrum]|eukprot:TMW62191.1 hypothetical protein Poli38472_009684 [Pythium oligandrum]